MEWARSWLLSVGEWTLSSRQSFTTFFSDQETEMKHTLPGRKNKV